MYLNTHKSYLYISRTLKFLKAGLYCFKPKGVWLGEKYIGENRFHSKWVHDFQLNYVPEIVDILETFEKFVKVNKCRTCGTTVYDNTVKSISKILNEFYLKGHKLDDKTILNK